MVAQILPDKSFVFILYDKQRKNEQSLLHAVLYGQKVYNVYWGGYHGRTSGTRVANRGEIRMEDHKSVFVIWFISYLTPLFRFRSDDFVCTSTIFN